MARGNMREMDMSLPIMVVEADAPRLIRSRIVESTEEGILSVLAKGLSDSIKTFLLYLRGDDKTKAKSIAKSKEK
jgi:hypothetical protein